MKNKILVTILSILFIIIIVGCSTNTSQTVDTSKDVEKEKETYIKYVQKLKKVDISTDELQFDVNITYDKLDNEEVRYQVVIDNAKADMNEVKVLAIHNKQTDDIFPSVGIFDKPIDLLQGDDKSGIILVGYIPYEGDMDDFECEMKVLISYESEEKRVTDYYVTKK